MDKITADYKKSFQMWNDVYSKCKLTNLAKKELSVEPTFDICLDLFAYHCKRVLDFGCGTGDVLFQVYQFGNLESGTGIDESEVGINYAKETAIISGFNNLEFLQGDIDCLKDKPDGCFDGIILSNVLDVMPTATARKVFTELTRLLSTDGWMFVKLNPYYDDQSLESYGFTKIKDNLYEEDGVLRYRELDTSQWKQGFEKHYSIERYLEFPYPWQDGMNRLFLLKKK
jgi:ubiquinone/menaquinone biosynthesis C-methylase UbiE